MAPRGSLGAGPASRPFRLPRQPQKMGIPPPSRHKMLWKTPQKNLYLTARLEYNFEVE